MSSPSHRSFSLCRRIRDRLNAHHAGISLALGPSRHRPVNRHYHHLLRMDNLLIECDHQGPCRSQTKGQNDNVQTRMGIAIVECARVVFDVIS